MGKPRKEMQLRVGLIRDETPDTKTFRLELGRATTFSFRPGQFIIIKKDLWNAKRNRNMPVKRAFSISSSPNDAGYLEITAKRYFKGRLTPWLHDEVHEGDFLNILGPDGKFVLESSGCSTLYFIAGGTGIAPLRSMIRYLNQTDRSIGIRLFYSARTPADFAFKEEMDGLSENHPDMKCIYTVTRPEGNTWSGKTGRFDRAFLETHLQKEKSRTYLCGPPSMVREIRSHLEAMGIPKDAVALEMW